MSLTVVEVRDIVHYGKDLIFGPFIPPCDSSVQQHLYLYMENPKKKKRFFSRFYLKSDTSHKVRESIDAPGLGVTDDNIELQVDGRNKECQTTTSNVLYLERESLVGPEKAVKKSEYGKRLLSMSVGHLVTATEFPSSTSHLPSNAQATAPLVIISEDLCQWYVTYFSFDTASDDAVPKVHKGKNTSFQIDHRTTRSITEDIAAALRVHSLPSLSLLHIVDTQVFKEDNNGSYLMTFLLQKGTVTSQISTDAEIILLVGVFYYSGDKRVLSWHVGVVPSSIHRFNMLPDMSGSSNLNPVSLSVCLESGTINIATASVSVPCQRRSVIDGGFVKVNGPTKLWAALSVFYTDPEPALLVQDGTLRAVMIELYSFRIPNPQNTTDGAPLKAKVSRFQSGVFPSSQNDIISLAISYQHGVHLDLAIVRRDGVNGAGLVQITTSSDAVSLQTASPIWSCISNLNTSVPILQVLRITHPSLSSNSIILVLDAEHILHAIRPFGVKPCEISIKNICVTISGPSCSIPAARILLPSVPVTEVSLGNKSSQESKSYTNNMWSKQPMQLRILPGAGACDVVRLSVQCGLYKATLKFLSNFLLTKRQPSAALAWMLLNNHTTLHRSSSSSVFSDNYYSLQRTIKADIDQCLKYIPLFAGVIEECVMMCGSDASIGVAGDKWADLDRLDNPTWRKHLPPPPGFFFQFMFANVRFSPYSNEKLFVAIKGMSALLRSCAPSTADGWELAWVVLSQFRRWLSELEEGSSMVRIFTDSLFLNLMRQSPDFSVGTRACSQIIERYCNMEDIPEAMRPLCAELNLQHINHSCGHGLHDFYPSKRSEADGSGTTLAFLRYITANCEGNTIPFDILLLGDTTKNCPALLMTSQRGDGSWSVTPRQGALDAVFGISALLLASICDINCKVVPTCSNPPKFVVCSSVNRIVSGPSIGVKPTNLRNLSTDSGKLRDEFWTMSCDALAACCRGNRTYDAFNLTLFAAVCSNRPHVVTSLLQLHQGTTLVRLDDWVRKLCDNSIYKCDARSGLESCTEPMLGCRKIPELLEELSFSGVHNTEDGVNSLTFSDIAYLCHYGASATPSQLLCALLQLSKPCFNNLDRSEMRVPAGAVGTMMILSHYFELGSSETFVRKSADLAPSLTYFKNWCEDDFIPRSMSTILVTCAIHRQVEFVLAAQNNYSGTLMNKILAKDGCSKQFQAIRSLDASAALSEALRRATLLLTAFSPITLGGSRVVPPQEAIDLFFREKVAPFCECLVMNHIRRHTPHSLVAAAAGHINLGNTPSFSHPCDPTLILDFHLIRAVEDFKQSLDEIRVVLTVSATSLAKLKCNDRLIPSEESALGIHPLLNNCVLSLNLLWKLVRYPIVTPEEGLFLFLSAVDVLTLCVKIRIRERSNVPVAHLEPSLKGSILAVREMIQAAGVANLTSNVHMLRKLFSINKRIEELCGLKVDESDINECVTEGETTMSKYSEFGNNPLLFVSGSDKNKGATESKKLQEEIIFFEEEKEFANNWIRKVNIGKCMLGPSSSLFNAIFGDSEKGRYSVFMTPLLECSIPWRMSHNLEARKYLVCSTWWEQLTPEEFLAAVVARIMPCVRELVEMDGLPTVDSMNSLLYPTDKRSPRACTISTLVSCTVVTGSVLDQPLYGYVCQKVLPTMHLVPHAIDFNDVQVSFNELPKLLGYNSPNCSTYHDRSAGCEGNSPYKSALHEMTKDDQVNVLQSLLSLPSVTVSASTVATPTHILERGVPYDRDETAMVNIDTSLNFSMDRANKKGAHISVDLGERSAAFPPASIAWWEMKEVSTEGQNPIETLLQPQPEDGLVEDTPVSDTTATSIDAMEPYPSKYISTAKEILLDNILSYSGVRHLDSRDNKRRKSIGGDHQKSLSYEPLTQAPYQLPYDAPSVISNVQYIDKIPQVLPNNTLLRNSKPIKGNVHISLHSSNESTSLQLLSLNSNQMKRPCSNLHVIGADGTVQSVGNIKHVAKPHLLGSHKTTVSPLCTPSNNTLQRNISPSSLKKQGDGVQQPIEVVYLSLPPPPSCANITLPCQPNNGTVPTDPTITKVLERELKINDCGEDATIKAENGIDITKAVKKRISIHSDKMIEEDCNRLYDLNEMPLPDNAQLVHTPGKGETKLMGMTCVSAITSLAPQPEANLSATEQVQFRKYVDELLSKDIAPSPPTPLPSAYTATCGIRQTQDLSHDEFLKSIVTQQQAMFHLQQDVLTRNCADNGQLMKLLLAQFQQGRSHNGGIGGSNRQYDHTSGLTAIQQSQLLTESLDQRNKLVQMNEKLADLKSQSAAMNAHIHRVSSPVREVIRYISEPQPKFVHSSDQEPCTSDANTGTTPVSKQTYEVQSSVIPTLRSVECNTNSPPYSLSAGIQTSLYATPIHQTPQPSGPAKPSSSAEDALRSAVLQLELLTEELSKADNSSDEMQRTLQDTYALIQRHRALIGQSTLAAEQENALDHLRRQAAYLESQLSYTRRQPYLEMAPSIAPSFPPCSPEYVYPSTKENASDTSQPVHYKILSSPPLNRAATPPRSAIASEMKPQSVVARHVAIEDPKETHMPGHDIPLSTPDQEDHWTIISKTVYSTAPEEPATGRSTLPGHRKCGNDWTDTSLHLGTVNGKVHSTGYSSTLPRGTSSITKERSQITNVSNQRRSSPWSVPSKHGCFSNHQARSFSMIDLIKTETQKVKAQLRNNAGSSQNRSTSATARIKSPKLIPNRFAMYAASGRCPKQTTESCQSVERMGFISENKCSVALEQRYCNTSVLANPNINTFFPHNNTDEFTQTMGPVSTLSNAAENSAYTTLPCASISEGHGGRVKESSLDRGYVHDWELKDHRRFQVNDLYARRQKKMLERHVDKRLDTIEALLDGY